MRANLQLVSAVVMKTLASARSTPAEA
ncbi:MAG: hypothetical protein RLZZ303_3503, partial [Candidatus Hydrogenedentota bacterium]